MNNRPAFDRRRAVYTLIYIGLASVMIWSWSSRLKAGGVSGQNQDTEKSLTKIESYDNEPLKIVGVKAANKSVRLGEKFDGADDWMRNANIRVKNVSDKTIIYIEIDLNFPETKASGNEMSYRLKLGHRPAAHNMDPSLELRTGEEAVLSLDGERYEQLVRFLEQRHPISGIRKGIVRIGFVIFVDGTAWSGGMFHRRDPNNPNRYIPVTE